MRKNAWITAVGLVYCLAVAVAVPFGIVPLGLTLAIIVVPMIFVVGLKHPAVLLLAYATVLPFEDALLIPGLGTLAKTLGLVLAGCYVMVRFRHLSLLRLPLPLWLFAAWSCLSVAWATSTASAISTMVLLGSQIGMALVITDMTLHDERVAERTLTLYALGSVFVSLYALLRGSVGNMGRLAAFAGQDQAMFAASLIPGVLFLMWKAVEREGSWLTRVGAIVGLLAPLVAIVASGTRSAWAGLLIGLLALLAMQRKYRAAVVLATLGAGVALILYTQPQLADFAMSRLESAISSGGEGRIGIWKVGLTILGDNPLVGVGIGNFTYAFTVDAIIRTPGVLDFGTWLYPGRAPHNIFLGVVAETGILGFALFGWFVVRTIHTAPRTGIGCLLLPIFLSYLTQGFFLDLLLRKPFWLVTALLMGLSSRNTLAHVNTRSFSHTGPSGSPSHEVLHKPVELACATLDGSGQVPNLTQPRAGAR